MEEKKDNIRSSNNKYHLFLKLFRENENALFGFIMKLLPNFSIAEEVMQETITTMWEKFNGFQEGTCFIAWAKQVARYKVMEYIKKKRGSRIVHFSDRVMDEIILKKPVASSQNVYFEAMHNCVDKLQDRNREIVRLRYTKEMKVKEIAQLMNTTSNALSKHMARIHHQLKKCIDQTLHAWDLTNG